MGRLVTENTVLQLKNPDAPIEDASSAEGTAWRETLATVQSMPGWRGAHWGRIVEQPGTVRLLIDLDDVSSHQAFEASPAYGPFLKQPGALFELDSPPCHAELTPQPDAALYASGAVEMATFYGCSGEVMPATEKLLAMLKSKEGFRGGAHGWVIEEIAKAGGEPKGRAYLALLGWDSIEAHMAATEGADFQEVVAELGRTLESNDLCHAKLVAV